MFSATENLAALLRIFNSEDIDGNLGMFAAMHVLADNIRSRAETDELIAKGEISGEQELRAPSEVIDRLDAMIEAVRRLVGVDPTEFPAETEVQTVLNQLTTLTHLLD